MYEILYIRSEYDIEISHDKKNYLKKLCIRRNQKYYNVLCIFMHLTGKLKFKKLNS